MAAIPYFLIHLTPIVAAIGWWLGGVGLLSEHTATKYRNSK